MRILQGAADTVVPPFVANEVVAWLESKDVHLTLVKVRWFSRRLARGLMTPGCIHQRMHISTWLLCHLMAASGLVATFRTGTTGCHDQKTCERFPLLQPPAHFCSADCCMLMN